MVAAQLCWGALTSSPLRGGRLPLQPSHARANLLDMVFSSLARCVPLPVVAPVESPLRVFSRRRSAAVASAAVAFEQPRTSSGNLNPRSPPGMIDQIGICGDNSLWNPRRHSGLPRPSNRFDLTPFHCSETVAPIVVIRTPAAMDGGAVRMMDDPDASTKRCCPEFGASSGRSSFLVPHRPCRPAAHETFCYSAAASSAPRSVFPWCA
jgi:hypothetical protein